MDIDKARWVRWACHGLWLGTVLLASANLLLAVLNGTGASGLGPGYPVGLSLMAVAFAAVGAVVTPRHPANPVGWLLSGIGAAIAMTGLWQSYAVYALTTRPGSLPFGEFAGWAGTWSWILSVFPAGTFLPLLFPDGRLPSRRWRAVGWLSAANLAAASVCFGAVSAGAGPPAFQPEVSGPGDVALVAGPAAAAGLLAVLSAAASRGRYRRARGDERAQLRWFGLSVALGAAAVAAQFVRPVAAPPDPWFASLLVLGTGTPVAIGFAISKYRLYDIDAVLRGTIVYATLAAFITVVYVAVVVGAGSLVGSHVGGGPLPPLVATAVAALGFGPVRARARQVADRLVHGVRATPYETLSLLSERLASAAPIEEFLPSLARALADATGASRTEVWVRVGDELRLAAAHPPRTAEPVPLLDGVPGADAVAEVRDGAEPLGAITIAKPPGDPVTARDSALAADLAAHAAIAFRDVARAAELRASRRRLVAAQDTERRRLERDLHDGAQQHLLAVAAKVGLARALLGDASPEVGALLDELHHDTGTALDTLRDLARGIFPAILAEKGLVRALRAHAARVPAEVAVAPALAGRRFAPEVEAAVYFCCLEALQNAAKHAAGSAPRLRLDLGGDGDVLEFAVSDGGPGFDPSATARGSGLGNMRDRIDAVGGRLEIRSSPGAGTTVGGRVPVPRADTTGQGRETVPGSG
ncbi:sensor histidine kinase [Actinomadura litoris]|uniref:sensor histidine kinase n=1 Tax=Actinomadura litoris TaxID=2678616 RepID=UPI001FA7C44B|nr:sensor histidine kinase [Actinomadura litoris]